MLPAKNAVIAATQLNIDNTWFANYLHDRTHSEKIDKIMSEAKSNLYGVPQGPILGQIVAHATWHHSSCHSQERQQLLSALRAAF